MNEEHKTKLADFIKRKHVKDKQVEILFIIHGDGICVGNIFGDPETISFKLDSTPENPGPPPSGGK